MLLILALLRTRRASATYCGAAKVMAPHWKCMNWHRHCQIGLRVGVCILCMCFSWSRLPSVLQPGFRTQPIWIALAQALNDGLEPKHHCWRAAQTCAAAWRSFAYALFKSPHCQTGGLEQHHAVPCYAAQTSQMTLTGLWRHWFARQGATKSPTSPSLR